MLVIVLGAVACSGCAICRWTMSSAHPCGGATDPAGSAVVAPPGPSADVGPSTPVNRPAEPPVVILADTQAASRSAIEPAVAAVAEPVLPPEDAVDPAPAAHRAGRCGCGGRGSGDCGSGGRGGGRVAWRGSVPPRRCRGASSRQDAG